VFLSDRSLSLLVRLYLGFQLNRTLGWDRVVPYDPYPYYPISAAGDPVEVWTVPFHFDLAWIILFSIFTHPQPHGKIHKSLVLGRPHHSLSSKVVFKSNHPKLPKLLATIAILIWPIYLSWVWRGCIAPPEPFSQWHLWQLQSYSQNYYKECVPTQKECRSQFWELQCCARPISVCVYYELVEFSLSPQRNP